MKAQHLCLGFPKSRSCEKDWTVGCLVGDPRKLVGRSGQTREGKGESQKGALISRLPLWTTGVHHHWGRSEESGRIYPRTNPLKGREVGAVTFWRLNLIGKGLILEPKKAENSRIRETSHTLPCCGWSQGHHLYPSSLPSAT